MNCMHRSRPRGWTALGALCLLAALAAALGGCVFETVPEPLEKRTAGGGGVETVGIRGVAYREDGRPAAGARVLLRSSVYLADSGIAGLRKPAALVAGEAVTDPAGRYAIDSVDPGDYVIEVQDAGTLGARVEATVLAGSAVHDVGPAVLRAPGSLAGRLVQAGLPVAGAWVHVYGMERSVATDAAGGFAFPVLPEGLYRIVVRQPRPYGVTATMTFAGIRITAGKAHDMGAIEFESGCRDGACDSLVVRHILDRNGKDTIPVDSVVLRDPVTGRIGELDLSRRGIASLPEVEDLTGLKRLELDNNGLTALPAGVTRITALEYLSLNNNRLRGLPREIGNLRMLTWLHLYNNQLDTLTPAVGALVSLRYLTVAYNLLRSLPEELGRLGNLNQLYIYNNRITNLSDDLLDLPKISVYNIHHNRLCNLSPRWQAFMDRNTDYDWRAYQTCP